MFGARGKRGLGEGLAEKVGKGLAKGWQRVGEGLAKGWQRVGWEIDLYTVVVLIFFEKFTANFSASAPVVYKHPPPMGPEISYTTGAGRGVKVTVAIFASSGGV